MRRPLILAITAFAAVAAIVLFGGVLHESPSAGARPISAEHVAAGFEPGYSSARDAAGLVRQLQQHLSLNPADADGHALLGLAYEQQARETGDPAYYPKADAALRRARELDDGNVVALSGQASLALSRHRFRDALGLARRARALAPSTARHAGAIGDALVELGRYRESFAAFDAMAQLKPGVAAYARVSYARELRGDRRGAIAAMRLAAESATPGSEAAAWTAVQLGELFYSGGGYHRAEHEFRVALGHVPGYAPALDALAMVEAARGRLLRAISLERRAVAAVPTPQYLATLGDLLARAGRPDAATRQYRRVTRLDRLERASGVRTDLEYALFRIDHGIELRAALAQARGARRDRPSIDGDDVLAWALYRNGRCAEALGYSRSALRLGTQDALKFFHRAMIERCLGHRAAARSWFRRAIALNRGFSVLWSPIAARYARLSG